MSLGFLSPPQKITLKLEKKNKIDNTIQQQEQKKEQQQQEEESSGISILPLKKCNKILFLFNSIFSFTTIILIFVFGLSYIPHENLVNFGNYGASVTVLNAMRNRFLHHTLVTVLGWLLPIIPGIFIPLYVTEVVLSVLSFTFGFIAIASLISLNERIYFVELLMNTPEIGYMWYEIITISISTFITQPNSFILIFLGPAMCVCNGPVIGKYQYSLYISIAILSIIFVLPTVAIFVDADNEFFLLGYSTPSIYGLFLSLSLILVWVKTYHLICRDVYQIFRKYNSKYIRIVGIIWVVLGTGLVLIWVSSAFVLHLAFSFYFKLTPEKSFYELRIIQEMKLKLKNTVRTHH